MVKRRPIDAVPICGEIDRAANAPIVVIVESKTALGVLECIR